MTIQQFLHKIATGWWIILLSTIAGFGFSMFYNNQPSYLASITIGVNLNNQTTAQLPEKELLKDQSYTVLSQQLSQFLKNRFSSPAIEYSIGNKMNKKVDSFSTKKSFYNITDQSLGYITLDLQTKSEDEGKKFVQAVKDEYTQTVVSEWNNQRPLDYQIKPMTEFVSAIIQVKDSPQTQILPAVAGLLIGVTICTLLPLATKSKHQ